MATITITELRPSHYAVDIAGGRTRTHHEVDASDRDWIDGIGGIDTGTLVRASVEFLLEHEAATSILPHFTLRDIAHYFPMYPDTMRQRLAAR